MKFNFTILLSVALLASGIDAKLTSDQKQTLLKLHKNARSAVNASNMKSISWSDSLAAKAQAYSEKCKGMVHSHTGPENLAGSTTGDVTRMFNNWMDEKSGFNASGYRSNFKDISYRGEDIGHYSQIVWAENTEVGCGMTDCPNYSARYLLVCNYKTGNVLGQKVYEVGSSHDDDDDDKKTTTRKTTTTTRSSSTTTTHKSTTTSSSTSTSSVSTTTPTATTTVLPTIAANTTLNNNSTVIDTGNTVPINEPVVEDNNNNDEKKPEDKKEDEEGIIEEVGPSSYTTGAGTYVTGIVATGSVVGAAAAFVFLKKNPNQYKQLQDNMKTISRNITRKATSVKRSATTVTRKITTKLPKSNSNVDVLDYDGSSYRYNFAKNLNVSDC